MTDMLVETGEADRFTNTVLELAAIQHHATGESQTERLVVTTSDDMRPETLDPCERTPELNCAVAAVRLMVELEEGIEAGGIIRRGLDRMTKVLSRVALRRQLETVTDWEDVVDSVRQVQSQ